ncbi:PREDICTED: trichohyalin isoform X2 [Habropoda laboriosa]|uniref:trichohyalin isoform X2 n=1 Tax=Habropoda laboriosa TaxID=597456 RepID=UPI00083D2F3C|nr:PREDICTED: trichohyalin isoform X2 [Habropoda laboriosa]
MPGAGGQTPQRTTFRPPWVKDGPTPLPMPTAPWTLNSRRDSKGKSDEPPAFTQVTLKSVPKPEAKPSTDAPQPRKQSKITIIPSQPKSEKNTSSQPAPKLRENGRQEPNSRPQLERQVRIERSRSRSDTIPLSKSESSTGAPTLSKSSSRAAIPPPPPPRPPPPPPSRTILKDLPPMNDNQQQKLEMLKQRPRKRPDWASMMKEVESGKTLRHVKCNDRSAPLIERVNKVTTADPAGNEHFVFESEKSNMHNQLLKQIQQGVKLKRVQTNDRSKPMLDGLRKFRRQLTIEEQMQKADEPTDDSISDDMDDIDAVRDDLQSTKQMLALELRNKEALERENKRLQARILNLETEVQREKSQKNVQEQRKSDEKLTESLKKEAQQARQDAEKYEKEYMSMSEERDKLKNELEEMKRMYSTLERRMKAGMALAGCPSAKDVAKIASQKSIDKKEPSESEEEEEEESEEEEDERDPKAGEKRLQREIKLLTTKIRNFRDKAVNARKERHALKDQIKQQQKLLKEEKKKFKHLQKEVDKMAKLMSETEEDEKDEEEDDNEETESEEESESEESEEEETETEDEDQSLEGQRNVLQKQAKKHEGRLAALKKGNYLLKAQVDRLKDDLGKQREESLTLQEDLDSVLAELG